MNKVVFVVGPTASGKSAVAVELALMLKTEIVSADAIAVYDRLEIGSARPTYEERKGVRHHLLGEIPLGDAFSASRFKEMASERIEAILASGKTPVVAGGTGLYVHALLRPLDAGASADEEFREEAKLREEASPGCLHEELKLADPAAAERIHPNDIKRVVRALEIARSGGNGGYDFRKETPLGFIPLVFGLSMPRETLYARIDARFDEMMRAGLLDEARAIYEEGFDPSLPGLSGLGYRQLFSHFRGECTLEEAVETAKRETRRFAKRQITWFKRENVEWIEADGKSAEALAREMYGRL